MHGQPRLEKGKKNRSGKAIAAGVFLKSNK